MSIEDATVPAKSRAAEWARPTEPLNELAGALAKAQAELKNPGFDSTNPHFRNKFASLAAVRNAVVPVLAKHGLSIIQNLTTLEGQIACETILLHSSGQIMRLGPLALPATKADAQGFGSAATYARRYSLMAVAGVVGDEDDDAEGAVRRSDAKGDYGKNIDPKVAAKKADEFRAAFDLDVDQEEIARAVFKVHEGIATDEDLYTAVGEQLTAKERTAIKEYVRQAKVQQSTQVAMNGRAR
jgi:hypothetical protein